MKPIIGVLPLYDDDKNSIWMLPGYLEGIRQAGGLPIILPLRACELEIQQLYEMCDGFLFTGGHDVNPQLYDEIASDECVTWNDERDFLEKLIFEKALYDNKAILGICRGIQLINTLLGGSLYQHLPSDLTGDVLVNHKMKPPYEKICHTVTIEESTPLYSLLGVSELGVNSYHHQGIKKLSDKLVPMAYSFDGLVEAVCVKEKTFIWAVQWHPEFSYITEESSRKILKAFIDATKGKR